ncbi:hypothetical protein B0H17DRAFT_1191211 [Mycena rosella]|uniref:Uncharacterized protein n=1 Tax=Mycena rosella TaxID=1033263 RepID=A0AAD7MB30_MYCRO|nr:hypothetical protein B0H17DRAFT_1191211 [Mycena rosella]
MQTASLPKGSGGAPAPVPPQKQHRRRRTMSVPPADGSSPHAKIKLAPLRTGSTSTVRPAAAGAFTLTGCARAALRCFAPGRDAYYMRCTAYADAEGDDDVCPGSPTCSESGSVPSISRTASPCEGERAPIPPGWGAWGKREREREWPPQKQRQRQKHYERPQNGKQSASANARIHPVLDELERGSRVGTGRVACAACGTPGTNFPRCTRCAQQWCSRECRTSATHRCAPRRAQTK